MCTCVGLSVVTPIRLHHLCIVYRSPVCLCEQRENHNSRTFLPHLSYICHQAVDWSSSELDPLYFLLPLLVQIGMLKGATKVVGQEEAEEVEETLRLE